MRMPPIARLPTNIARGKTAPAGAACAALPREEAVAPEAVVYDLLGALYTAPAAD
jgi:hypothetical protein